MYISDSTPPCSFVGYGCVFDTINALPMYGAGGVLDVDVGEAGVVEVQVGRGSNR